MKTIIKVLIATNVLLILVGLYLFQVEDPSNLVSFGKIFITGTNIFFLLANLRLLTLAR